MLQILHLPDKGAMGEILMRNMPLDQAAHQLQYS
jgi:hypothetical protein